MKSYTQSHIVPVSELPIEDIEIYLEKAYEVMVIVGRLILTRKPYSLVRYC